jgi:hypothetical protein
LAILLWVSVLLSAPLALAQQGPHTPKPGTPERKAIADAMRAKGDDHSRVFVVRYLMVQDGWAWIVADPHSSDGKNHYETESALLRKDATGWKVVDQPCSEFDCDADRELARIKQAFPAAPPRIFPNDSAK